MSRSNRYRQTALKLLLLINLFLYTAFVVVFIDSTKYRQYDVYQGYIVGMAIWSFVLILHSAIYFYYRGRGDISQLEREAYRDGYADAMHQPDVRSVPLERLALDDEGELVGVVEKRKRSY